MSDEITNIPENILNKIQELKNIETFLGHLPSENWTVAELQKRAEDPTYSKSLSELEKKTETLFGQICEELMQIKFNYTQIADTINAQFASSTSRLKYCNEAEVKEAIGVS